MLASTVQFSNNDPYPVTHTLTVWYTGTGRRDKHFCPYPQTPNSVPDTIRPLALCSTPKQY